MPKKQLVDLYREAFGVRQRGFVVMDNYEAVIACDDGGAFTVCEIPDGHNRELVAILIAALLNVAAGKK